MDRHGQTPLQGASGKGDLAKVRQILEVAIDPVAYINHQDYAGHTALHAAALKGHSDVVKFLVESGAELNLINKNTDTPLDDAADNSEQEIVDYLLSKGGKHADKTKSQSKPSLASPLKLGFVQILCRPRRAMWVASQATCSACLSAA